MMLNSQQVVTPATGTTVNINNSDGDIVYLINPAATIAALTVTMPSDPHDQQKVTIASSKIITAFTLSSTGTILGNPTTFATANDYAKWAYHLTGTTWYRIG